MVEELYTLEQLPQIHDSLWQCVLQFANLSAAQERNRIARDLHDSLGHALTALNFQLQTAIKLCKFDPTQAQEFLNEAHRRELDVARLVAVGATNQKIAKELFISESTVKTHINILIVF